MDPAPLPNPSPYTCPNCGHSLEQWQEFCPHCGAPLEAGSHSAKPVSCCATGCLAVFSGTIGSCLLLSASEEWTLGTDWAAVLAVAGTGAALVGLAVACSVQIARLNRRR
jgi:hypothetical protein